MKATICDACGQPITGNVDSVSVHAWENRVLPRLSTLTKDAKALEDQIAKESQLRLDVSLDLHRQCYLDHVLPTIEGLRS